MTSFRLSIRSRGCFDSVWPSLLLQQSCGQQLVAAPRAEGPETAGSHRGNAHLATPAKPFPKKYCLKTYFGGSLITQLIPSPFSNKRLGKTNGWHSQQGNYQLPLLSEIAWGAPLPKVWPPRIARCCQRHWWCCDNGPLDFGQQRLRQEGGLILHNVLGEICQVV